MVSYEVILYLISNALVLMIFSFLYRDNRWFALASNIFIGGATAYVTSVSIKRIYYEGLVPIFQGKYWYILTLIIGSLLFMRFFKRYSWWVRIPTAIIIGSGLGLNMATGVKAMILSQIVDTMRSIFTPSSTTNINNLIIIVGVCSTMMYFFFSRETKGVMLPINNIGKYFLMFGIGASFAYALLGRTALLIGRWKDILSPPYYYLLPIAIALILYDIVRSKGTS